MACTGVSFVGGKTQQDPERGLYRGDPCSSGEVSESAIRRRCSGWLKEVGEPISFLIRIDRSSRRQAGGIGQSWPSACSPGSTSHPSRNHSLLQVDSSFERASPPDRSIAARPTSLTLAVRSRINTGGVFNTLYCPAVGKSVLK